MIVEGIPALVTGGASGLGHAVAKRLASRGARVTILDIDGEGGRQRAAVLGCHFEQCDIVDEGAVMAALDGAEAQHGVARILVNCAGVGPPAKAVGRDGEAMPLAVFNRTIAINLLGSFNVLSKFAARLQRIDPIGEERGAIVNTASIAAFDGQIGQASYSASKAAIVGMTLPLAREFARSGIRVMTIAPGVFLTPILETLSEEARHSLGQQIPFPKRLGDPMEFAHMVEAMIANPMMNGETVRLDGAIRMAPN